MSAELEPRNGSVPDDGTVIPRCVGATAERVIEARGHDLRLKRVLVRSLVPIVLVDDSRRYMDVNTAARLVFRRSLAELRRLRIDDLTPPHEFPTMEDAWTRLMETGCVAGPYEVDSPNGSRFAIRYYALADALPGQHAIVFVPEWANEGEFLDSLEELDTEPNPPLTQREREVLELAAEGYTGPAIARNLVVCSSTVKTHFAHIYAKLGVRDRGAAVAKAMRLGLVA